MPFMNGPDAVKRIREICEQIVSGKSSSDDLEMARCLPLDFDRIQR